MWERLQGLLVVMSLGLLLGACASTAAPTSSSAPLSASARPIPEAPAVDFETGEVLTRAVVVVENSDGVGATWSSVTESQAMKTAAELSNLGGAPLVLGAVGAIVVADAAPRGRAARTADAINANIDVDMLHDGLADALGDVLADDPQSGAVITTQEVKRIRDLPEDAWVVFTDYELAEDGSALKATARVGHAEDFRHFDAVERELKRQDSEYYRSGTLRYSYESMAREQSRRRRVRERLDRYTPRYTNVFVYHSDMFVLPETGDMMSDDERAKKEDRLIRALDAERDARVAAARAAHAETLASTDKPGKIRKADRQLDKALKKAESLHEKSLAKARDGKLDKMERLVLGMERWADGEADGSAISVAIEEAQDFFADAMARELPYVGTVETEEREPTDRELAKNLQMLSVDDSGRLVAQVITGPSAGVIVSVPEEGTADYGQQTAKP